MNKNSGVMGKETVMHPIPPVFDENSEILILGSFPSVKSREQVFFYAHPQNRFWKVIAALFEEKVPDNTEEKRSLLLKHNVAVWDVIKSCEIEGSSDSSIKNVQANNIGWLLENSSVKRIFVNGKTAKKYYDRYVLPNTGIMADTLPSTSPANAAWSTEKLIKEWEKIIL